MNANGNSTAADAWLPDSSSLSRRQKRQVKFLRVVSSHTSPDEFRRIARGLKRTDQDNSGGDCEQQVIASDDVIGTIVEQASEKGVIVHGVQRLGPKTKLFGDFTRRIARQSHSPIIIISRRG